jgi:hypothetical protein
MTTTKKTTAKTAPPKMIPLAVMKKASTKKDPIRIRTNQQSCQRKMEGQLQQWGVRLRNLEAKAKNAGGDAKQKLLGELEELRQMEVAGRQDLARVETATASAWDEMRTDLDQRWGRLTVAINAIWTRVK